MIELRNLVIQADEQGKAIPESLTNLRNYVTVHMNTGMGETGLYLAHSYQRAYSRAVQSAIQSGGASAIIYQHADQVCQGQAADSFQAYIQCMSDEVAASGSPSIQAPSADLYHYNFISPAWSPDVAGVTLFAAILSAILIASQLVLTWGVRLLLRSRHRVS